MKRLLLSVAFAVIVVVAGLSCVAYGSDFGFWLLFRPLPVFLELLPPHADEGFFRFPAVSLSLFASAALYAHAAYLFLGRPRALRLP